MSLCIALVAASTAYAEDSAFVGAAEPVAAEKPETKLSAELGATYATGNAAFYTVNGGGAVSHEWDKNKFAAIAGVNIGGAVTDADGDGLLQQAERDVGLQENVRRLFTEARYDRFLTDKDSLYVLAGAFTDRFAGYDLRTHEQLGYSRLLVDTEDTEVRAELGFDWAQEDYVDGVDPNYQNIFAGRLLLALTHKFNDSVAFSDTFELYENVVDPNDLRILNTAALTSNVSTKLSLKVSHALIFDNVPVDGYLPLDQTTMLTFVATLL